MEIIGINSGFLLTQLVNMVLLAGWLVFAALALVQLRGRRLEELPRVLWVLVVLVVPLLGAVAFFVVQPGRKDA